MTYTDESIRYAEQAEDDFIRFVNRRLEECRRQAEEDLKPFLNALKELEKRELEPDRLMVEIQKLVRRYHPERTVIRLIDRESVRLCDEAWTRLHGIADQVVAEMGTWFDEAIDRSIASIDKWKRDRNWKESYRAATGNKPLHTLIGTLFTGLFAAGGELLTVIGTGLRNIFHRTRSVIMRFFRTWKTTTFNWLRHTIGKWLKEKRGKDVRWMWVCTFMNSRDSHIDTHRQIRNQGIPFVTGAGHAMRYPGDRNGPIEEWINCRCYLVPVNAVGTPLNGRKVRTYHNDRADNTRR